ncbi:MAG: hypothetical protein A2Z88_01935 [Omnitrophica WOR_2 bacterium GWA2_47_8]|nr:MAG: hypothetical protein A2Z88_01935 [Omnitrophica WOR_2 bacterium GWA2_47_8]
MFQSLIKRIKDLLGFPDLTTFVFEFRGWNDDVARDACNGNVDERDAEISANRAGPTHPPGIWEITSSDERPTAIGARIRIVAEPRLITPAAAKEYLKSIGVDADPVSSS